MNFGNVGFAELGFLLLIWSVPIGLIIWFIRTLSSMPASLRQITDRLASLERAVRDAPSQRAP